MLLASLFWLSCKIFPRRKTGWVKSPLKKLAANPERRTYDGVRRDEFFQIEAKIKPFNVTAIGADTPMRMHAARFIPKFSAGRQRTVGDLSFNASLQRPYFEPEKFDIFSTSLTSRGARQDCCGFRARQSSRMLLTQLAVYLCEQNNLKPTPVESNISLTKSDISIPLLPQQVSGEINFIYSLQLMSPFLTTRVQLLHYRNM